MPLSKLLKHTERIIRLRAEAVRDELIREKQQTSEKRHGRP